MSGYGNKFDKHLIFEEKCRKCGNVREVYFADRHDHNTWCQFDIIMTDQIKNPQLSECTTCKRHTVHDVISYSGHNFT
jgi:ribosomal protein L44E